MTRKPPVLNETPDSFLRNSEAKGDRCNRQQTGGGYLLWARHEAASLSEGRGESSLVSRAPAARHSRAVRAAARPRRRASRLSAIGTCPQPLEGGLCWEDEGSEQDEGMAPGGLGHAVAHIRYRRWQKPDAS
jgi:hypothetical protein